MNIQLLEEIEDLLKKNKSLSDVSLETGIARSSIALALRVYRITKGELGSSLVNLKKELDKQIEQYEHRTKELTSCEKKVEHYKEEITKHQEDIEELKKLNALYLEDKNCVPQSEYDELYRFCSSLNQKLEVTQEKIEEFNNLTFLQRVFY